MTATDFCVRAEYCGQMDPREVQIALRKLWTDKGLDPKQVAAQSGVDRATVYRIAKVDKSYSPSLETVIQILEAVGTSATTFFAGIERSDLTRHSRDPRSALPSGGDADVTDLTSRLLKIRERDRALASEVSNVVGRLTAIAERLESEDGGTQSPAARSRKSRRAAHR